jgi:hypothetical protein
MRHAATRGRRGPGHRSTRSIRARGATFPFRSVALALAMALLPISSARASDPLLTILKGTLLGSVTGLVLGGTLTLVVDDDSRSETVRWGVVIGTFAGFGVGVWQVAAGHDDLFGAAQGILAAPGAGAWGLEPAAAADERASRRAPEWLASTPGCQVRLSLLRLSW